MGNNFIDGSQYAQKLALEKEREDRKMTMEEQRLKAYLENANFERQRAEKKDYWDNWDRGAKQTTQDDTRSFLAGQTGLGEVPGHVDPNAILTMWDKRQDNQRANAQLAISQGNLGVSQGNLDLQRQGTWSPDAYGNIVNSRTGEAKAGPGGGSFKDEGSRVIQSYGPTYGQGDPQKDSMYSMAFQGKFVKVGPNGPYRLPTPEGTPVPKEYEGIPLAGAQSKVMTAENATKAQGLTEALKAIDTVEKDLLGDGNLGWAETFGAKTLPVTGEQKTTNRNLQLTREMLLRALSGAGVPETEVQRYSSLIDPSYFDSVESYRKSLNVLRSFLSGSLKNMGKGDGAGVPTTSSPTAPAQGSMGYQFDDQGNLVQ